jgi:PAS domain S-box-containing protein
MLHRRDAIRRRSEWQLRESEERFRLLVTGVADYSIIGLDVDGRVTSWNSGAEQIKGYRADDIIGCHFSVFYSPEDLAAGVPAAALATAAVDGGIEVDGWLVRQNGTRFWANVVITALFDDDHRLRGFAKVTRDITERRQAEEALAQTREQLAQAQKMEAIGQLAGGVAHDFNNILTVIQGHASLLASSKLGELEEKSASQIVQAAGRAAALTRQLLTFSRRQIIQPKRLDMNKIVGNMTNMLGRLLGEDIALQLNYCQAPPIVEADAGMMEQILLNLAVNARDAMPKGGQLAIRITVNDVDEKYLSLHPDARKGNFICINVTDTGTGISPENLPRIFEPFFTTKEIGKGTGLGLATVYGIVKQHQGWIELESHVGRGTTFRIFLPRVNAEQAGNEKQTTAITVRGGKEAILLVEDERPVRELVARVLERYGYKIFQADTGADALEVWGQNKDEIKLVLTDLVMPNNMNGRELAERMWAEMPALKVIFTSGYSADIVGKDFKLQPELNFLQKPYQPQMLALTIRRCLDGKHN